MINKKILKNEEGFTLIELLVVIVIIGVLAAIALPIFLNQQKAAIDAGFKNDLRNIGTQLQTSAAQTGAPNLNISSKVALTESTKNAVVKSELSNFLICYDKQSFTIFTRNPESNTSYTYSTKNGGLKDFNGVWESYTVMCPAVGYNLDTGDKVSWGYSKTAGWANWVNP